MKAYLVVTGILFAVIAFAHLLRTIVEVERLKTDPWFVMQGPGLGFVAAFLSIWAWRLLLRSR